MGAELLREPAPLNALPAPPGPARDRWYMSPRPLAQNRLSYFEELHQQHGDIVLFRAGFRQICFINHPDYIREVFVTQSEKFRKGLILQVSRALLGNGLLTSEGDFHRRQRRLMAPAFHKKRIEGYCESMVRHATAMRDTWQPGQVFDLYQEMNRLTLSIIGETMFGAEVAGEAEAVNRALEGMFRLVFRIADPVQLLKFLLPLPGNFAFLSARKRLNRIVYGMIEERRRNTVQREDMLGMLLAARDEEDGAGMTDRQIRDEVLIVFLAGHETTANALTWTFYLLTRHPEIEARLQEEVDRAFSESAPGFDMLPRLPYTRMVLEEAMRLYPPAHTIGREALADVQLGEYRIKKGTTVLSSPWVMHRDSRYYPDPERFDPSRWTPERKEARPKFCYFPFGAGPRICIGEQFAWAEATLVLAVLARRWTLRLAQDHPVEPLPLITLRPKEGVRMRAVSRVL